jgi:hypothetical protein
MEFGKRRNKKRNKKLCGSFGATAVVLMAGLAIAGCSRFELESFQLPKLSDQVRLPTLAASAPVGPQGPARPEELVDAQGNCAQAPMASATAGVEGASTDPVTVPTNTAQALGGIGLAMTECDVVKRAGAPEKMELGTNERSERTLMLTYIQGTRPGIYSFVAGRLIAIERAPEPPAPPKPVKPAKTAKPKPKPKSPAT